MTRSRRVLLATPAALTLALLAPGAAHGASPDCSIGSYEELPGSSGTVIRVPQDHREIRDAVEQAGPGDTILVGPGRYQGGIEVKQPGLRIRGTDRDAVIVDGSNKDDPEDPAPFGIQITADRVMVENMTLRTFKEEAISWRPAIDDEGKTDRVEGYWGRYLTVTGAGHTTVLAAGARCGQLDHIVATGAAFGGITIQGCDPCDTVVTRNIAKQNSFGFIALDAGSGTHLGYFDGEDDKGKADDNVATANHVGFYAGLEDPVHWPPPDEDANVLTPHSRRGPAIRDNVSSGNNADKWPVGTCAAESPPQDPGWDPENTQAVPCTTLGEQYNGTGVFLFNARATLVEGNRVEDNRRLGVQLAGLWQAAIGNVVRGNRVKNNGYPSQGIWTGADLYQDTVVGPGNCWEGNDYDRAEPFVLETVWRCDLPTTPPGGVTANARCKAWAPAPPGSEKPLATCWTWNGEETTPKHEPNSELKGRQQFWRFEPPTDVDARRNAPRDDGAVDEWLPELRKALPAP